MELVRQKNVATIITFPIVDADGDIVTGATALDSEIDTWSDSVVPDGFIDCTNEATEIGATGIYYLSLTQAEMNVDYIYIQVKTTSVGAKTQHILIRTIVGDPLNIATTDDGGTINVTGGAIDTVTTLTGHTPQTGDSFPLVSTEIAEIYAAVITNAAGADIAADIIAVKADTAAILLDTGTDGVILPQAQADKVWATAARVLTAGTNIVLAKGVGVTGFNDLSAAQVNTEVDTALSDIDLDHFIQVDAGVEEPTDGSYLDQIMHKAVGQTFDATTDSLEALRDRGDTAWITATGFSTHTAANVAALILVTPAQKLVTDASGFVTANLNGDLTATMKASVGDAVWDEVLAAHTTLDTAGLVLNMLTQDAVTLATDVALGSIIGQMLDAGTAWSYDRTTDSLEILGAATAPSAATIADAVWDELIAGHLGAGSTGASLNAAGSAGDPWTTLIPGAYGAGTAGNILGNALTGHIPQTGDSFVRLGAPVGASMSADVAVVQADTDNIQTRLPAALVGGRMDSSVGAMAAGVVTAAAIATGAIDADALASDAVDEIWNEAMDAHGSTARSILKSLFAIPEGKCIQDANDLGKFTWYEQDGVTIEFVQTYLGLTRTVA